MRMRLRLRSLVLHIGAGEDMRAAAASGLGARGAAAEEGGEEAREGVGRSGGEVGGGWCGGGRGVLEDGDGGFAAGCRGGGSAAVRRASRGKWGGEDLRFAERGCVRRRGGPVRAGPVEVSPAGPDETQLAEPGGVVVVVVVVVVVGASALAHHRREAVAQAALDGDGAVHVRGVLAHAEEEEDEHAHDGGDVAVEGQDVLLGEVDDDVPCGGVVHFGPVVGGPWDADVDVEEEDGHGRVDDDEGDGGDEEAEEARRVEGVCAEHGGDAGAVAAETEDHEDWGGVQRGRMEGKGG